MDTAVANPLSRKIKKILDMKLDSDKELVEAMKSLSTFFGDNNLRNRKNLRSVIERRGLKINQEFLNDYRTLKKQIDQVTEEVQGMSQCCEEMSERLKKAKTQTASLISNTSELRKEGRIIEMRQQAASTFIEKFQLTSAQFQTLRAGPNEPLSEEFFTALDRVQEIHSKVKVLLRSNQQTAGLEIMEEMALFQEAGYERLYRWGQSQTRSLTSEEIEVSSTLQRAMKALSDRAVLFRYTLDEYANARKSTTVRGFIEALTRGSRDQAQPRPIELHSHDPLRYVGDMAAWIHQCAATERENFNQLIKQCPEHLVAPHRRDMMLKILEGVCRPLKIRLEHILVAEPGPVALYKLSNLLQFYQRTIRNVFRCKLLNIFRAQTLEELQVLCKKMFFNSLTFMSQKFTSNVAAPPTDLGCNQTLTNALKLLRDILSIQDGNVAPMEDRRKDFKMVLTTILDPLLQNCQLSASHLSMADMSTYMMNSLQSIVNTLSFYEFGVEHRLEMLQGQVDAHASTLSNEQAAFILTRGGIATIYATCDRFKPESGEKLSSMPGLDQDSLTTGLSQFESYLSNPDVHQLPQFNLLNSPITRNNILKTSQELVFASYLTVYKALEQTDCYDNIETLLRRTPDQIKRLLC
ncbi:unnamed protein product [Oikopleura dioica]|uniref:Conserved oligomeric Golgi complex subunit 6 n=1 Tax=Oikopleura dioica TaxID=34765 RepID=E4YF16_OIKDI|nr:unnamed protein product [Oikopleura dioica]